MNAQEANGEQREKNGGKFAETDDFGRAVLKRKTPETAPTQGKRAKKIPTDKGWDFTLWWAGDNQNKTLIHCFQITNNFFISIDTGKDTVMQQAA